VERCCIDGLWRKEWRWRRGGEEGLSKKPIEPARKEGEEEVKWILREVGAETKRMLGDPRRSRQLSRSVFGVEKRSLETLLVADFFRCIRD
jgi:hypothetical protein